MRFADPSQQACVAKFFVTGITDEEMELTYLAFRTFCRYPGSTGLTAKLGCTPQMLTLAPRGARFLLLWTPQRISQLVRTRCLQPPRKGIGDEWLTTLCG
jgi:hypothetical protein